jgi:ABC-type glycerol-3-phosphate transport system substrate-binding protein
MVNQRSNNKEEAVKFLKWITEKQQQVYLAEETNNLPSNKESLSAIAPSLRQFADDMDKTVHPSLLPGAEHPLVIEAFDKGIQSIIIGENSPREIAERVQAVKDRERR